MGSEKILKKIKSSATAGIVFGIILTLLGVFLIFCIILVDDKGFEFLYAIFGGLSLIGILLFAFGIRNFKDPTKSGTLKKNPDLLAQADQLYSDIRFEDSFIILSSRVIASKKKPLQMAYLNEVFLAYISKESYNFVPTSKNLTICTARGMIQVSVYGRSKATIEQLFQNIAQSCPYIRLGYTQDNLGYLSYMRQLYSQKDGPFKVENNNQITQ